MDHYDKMILVKILLMLEQNKLCDEAILDYFP